MVTQIRNKSSNRKPESFRIHVWLARVGEGGLGRGVEKEKVELEEQEQKEEEEKEERE